MRNNPFKMYDEKGYQKRNRQATRKIRKSWTNFVNEIDKLQNKYRDVGLSDTQSRECTVEWVRKHVEDLF